jgi:hypothetical protein
MILSDACMIKFQPSPACGAAVCGGRGPAQPALDSISWARPYIWRSRGETTERYAKRFHRYEFSPLPLLPRYSIFDFYLQ